MSKGAHYIDVLKSLARTIPKAISFRSIISFGEAPGDDLLCTAVAHELMRRRRGPVGIVTRNGSLFLNNPDITGCFDCAPYGVRALSRISQRFITPYYTSKSADPDRDVATAEHVLCAMCRRAGIEGEIALRPYLFLDPVETEAGKLGARQIAIQSSAGSARFPIRNKEWYPERFKEVVRALEDQFTFVQVGLLNDPPLDTQFDLRGMTSLRGLGAILANSILFIGLEGFLMHMARAVDTRSVIVFGGRVKPWQFGYNCNQNLVGETICSPCWQWNRCEYDRECMKIVTSQMVVDAAISQIEHLDSPLEVETVTIR